MQFRWQRRHNRVLRTGPVSSPRLQPLISAIGQVLLGKEQAGPWGWPRLTGWPSTNRSDKSSITSLGKSWARRGRQVFWSPASTKM